jgi:hypothetical protein
MSAEMSVPPELHDRAYDAMDRGALADASREFAALLELRPGWAPYHYMRGLVHKYLRDWPTSLEHNLRSIELRDDFDDASHWNASIAATALGNWEVARRMWAACEIPIAEGTGPIVADFGVAVVRLNPWKGGETVFMRRIDPVRARLLNVPFPESGHRFGDIVLHDGAQTGSRYDGERQVPVFNELARLVPSEFQTFVVFATCPEKEHRDALVGATAPGIGYSEDWTNLPVYCLRCSYGTPHRHEPNEADAWQRDRNLGIAAQSRKSVEKLLKEWSRGGRGRRIEGIEAADAQMTSPEEGQVWWEGPEEAEESQATSEST